MTDTELSITITIGGIMDLYKKVIIAFFVFCPFSGTSQTVTYRCTYNFGNNTEYLEATSSPGSINVNRKINNLKYIFVIPNTKR